MRGDQLTIDNGVNIDAAKEFLSVLGPKAKSWTFQTFDDQGQDEKLACILHGTLDEHADTLSHLNRRGAGVFAAVNRTDGKGRKRENITKVRAITVDLDGASLDPVRQFVLKPHILVESSAGRYHGYWRVRNLPLERFEDVQRALAKRFDGDPSVARLTHVARLPGFDHRKSDPFRTRIIDVNDIPAYSAEEILTAFSPLATPHKPSVSRPNALVLDPKAPLKCAEEFVKREFQQAWGATDPIFCFYFYRGGFYRYVGTHYEEVDADFVSHRLYKFLNDAWLVNGKTGGLLPFNPSQAKVNAILHALKAGPFLPRDKNAPFWLPPMDHMKDGLLACQNGLLDIETKNLISHSPAFFNVNSLPFDYDPVAPRPTAFYNFLHELWPGDEGKQARLTLQEMFGLLLTSNTSFQKIFLIIGPKRSGKGTIGRVLKALLGRDNVAWPTMRSMGGEFGLWPLIDKRVAIISDARIASSDAQVVAERLLSISGEDGQTINRKYATFWHGQLGVRFLIMTNKPPRIADASGALVGRYVVLTLHRSFYGQEDKELTIKLLGELPGILNWSLRGLDRLLARGYFKIPDASKDMITALEDAASPVGAFVRDWCEVGPKETETVKLLYVAWQAYCSEQGDGRPGTANQFGTHLREVVPQVVAKGRTIKRRYQGVGLSAYGRQRYERALKREGLY